MPNIWTTLAAGAIGGLAASFVMERYQAAAGPTFGREQDGGESATSKAADKVVAIVGAAPIPKDRKPEAGEIVHYVTGLTAGLVYAVAVHRDPRAATGFGTVSGAVLMAVLDDVAVPAAGLGPTPIRTDLATQAYSLSSHLVFGAALEGTRRSVVALLD